MVTNITNFGRSGLSDWLVQRVSAVILVLYTVFIVLYLLLNPGLDYATWSGLFAQTWIRPFSLQAYVPDALQRDGGHGHGPQPYPAAAAHPHDGAHTEQAHPRLAAQSTPTDL